MPTSIPTLLESLSKRLEYLAAQTGRSKAFYLRQMIENGLDDLEDYYLAADVLERGPQRGRKNPPWLAGENRSLLGRLLTPKPPGNS
jgi:RHH-type rel operon transcriptional repressor/antitoxin RelB